MQTEIGNATAGVNNFRKFQLDMTEKMSFVHGVARAALWIGGVLGVLFLSVFTYSLTILIPAAKVIVEDYYRNHPVVKQTIEQQHRSPAPVLANQQSTIPEFTRSNP